ncbi:hypothetical protein [Apilactobacillus quenuiae]|uniref:hypothetical protein n=1 Tax=Apilactobacillus quenuiae TaxID=2008377 RepID=UPI000D0184FC|nr:hypothetical protein [Apilactobacillus quenuiae]
MKFKKLISISLVTASSLLCIGLAENSNVLANANHHKRVHKVVNKKKSIHKKAKKHAFKPAINKWYKGTPKQIRGTWYHNDSNPRYNAYIKYNANQSAGNYFTDNVDGTFTPQFAKGLFNIHYMYSGGHQYKIRGVEYSGTDENGKPDNQHQYYEYNVNIYPHKLHYQLGHNVKDYTRHANFDIKQNNR